MKPCAYSLGYTNKWELIISFHRIATTAARHIQGYQDNVQRIISVEMLSHTILVGLDNNEVANS